MNNAVFGKTRKCEKSSRYQVCNNQGIIQKLITQKMFFEKFISNRNVKNTTNHE